MTTVKCNLTHCHYNSTKDATPTGSCTLDQVILVDGSCHLTYRNPLFTQEDNP